MSHNMRIYIYIHSILLAMNWHHDEVWHELWPVIKHQRVYKLGRKAHSQTRHWCPGNSQGSADWLGNDDGILPKKNANLEYHKDPQSLVAELVAIAFSSMIAAGCSYCFWIVLTCGHFSRPWMKRGKFWRHVVTRNCIYLAKAKIRETGLESPK